MYSSSESMVRILAWAQIKKKKIIIKLNLLFFKSDLVLIFVIIIYFSTEELILIYFETDDRIYQGIPVLPKIKQNTAGNI